MGVEFELKYSATQKKLREIAEIYPPEMSVSMETTYYDTPQGALAARKMTLRCRKENGRFVCTVKTPERNGARGEWELEGADIAQALPELCKLGCPVDLVSLCQAGLKPICAARFTRRLTTLTLPRCTAELALDAGVLLGGNQEQPFCEVELELKTGEADALLQFVSEFAQKFDLQAEPKSKFRRALLLAEGE